jgi:ferrous-iron efflux pump FieF
MPETASSADHSARLLKLATNASVTVALVLIAAKSYAWWQTQSVSILASLIDSLMDSGASLLNLIAVRYALMPADRNHRFGHGKAESIAALLQGLFIVASGLFLIVEATQRLLSPVPVSTAGLGIVVMLFTIAATLALLSLQAYVIRRTHSAAIRADALHYRTDVLTNSAVLLALVLAHFGWTGMDPLFALAIAVYILLAARTLIMDAVNELLDRELPEPRRQQILGIARAHPQVQGVHDLRTRAAGRVEFIEMHLELDEQMPLIKAHHIADQVVAAIRERIPTADVIIHQDPAGLNERRRDQQLA